MNKYITENINQFLFKIDSVFFYAKIANAR